VIEQYQPHEAAVEETFVNSNARAALVLGQARGVALAAAARRGLNVAEYAPTTIKKAVVGSGGADKTQIAFMVQRLLPTAGAVTADAADALGVALCHAAHGGLQTPGQRIGNKSAAIGVAVCPGFRGSEPNGRSDGGRHNQQRHIAGRTFCTRCASARRVCMACSTASRTDSTPSIALGG
jgi:hypothetical protein